MSPVIAFFGLILALYLAWRAYHAIKDYIHESRLHPIIPFTRRHLVVPAHGQRVQLSPAEASMARAALEFHGAMRITVVAMLSGPDIEDAQLKEALARLVAAHPFLRSKILEVRVGPLPLMVAEVDDTLRIPVTHTHMKDVRLEAAWRSVYEKHEKEPMVLGAPLARVDVISSGVPAGLGEDGATQALMFSCEAYQPVAQYWAPALETACAATGVFGPIRWLYRVIRFFSFPTPKGAVTFPSANESLVPRAMSATCATRKQYGDLSVRATAKLLLACHARHTTVTGAISAAAARAVARVVAASKHTKPSPAYTGNNVRVCLSYFADMRHHVYPPIAPNCLCLNVSIMPPFLTTVNLGDTGSTSLWEISKAARRGIEAGLRAEYMNLVGVMMGPVCDVILANKPLGDTTISAAVSNGGLAPKTDGYGPWVLTRVRPVVNMSFARYPTVLVETAAGHLTVTLLSPRNYISDADADRMLTETMLALADLIGSASVTPDPDGLVLNLDVSA